MVVWLYPDILIRRFLVFVFIFYFFTFLGGLVIGSMGLALPGATEGIGDIA